MSDKSRALIKSRLRAAFLNPVVKEKCFKDFVLTFERTGLSAQDAAALTEHVAQEIVRDNRMEETEQAIQAIFKNTEIRGRGFFESIQADLRAREEIIIGQISPFLSGIKGKVIDFGAGSGKIAQTIHERFGIEIEAVDVSDFKNPDVTIPFRLFDGRKVPVADQYYEAAVMANVAHHAEDNETILRELTRITRKRLVVIETVPADESEEEWQVTFVSDTLWNRFFHYADIPVPGTYEQASGWISRFARHGWTVNHSESLGYDQPMVRVMHHLLIFGKS